MGCKAWIPPINQDQHLQSRQRVIKKIGDHYIVSRADKDQQQSLKEKESMHEIEMNRKPREVFRVDLKRKNLKRHSTCYK